METETAITFYSPSAIISTFNAALQNLNERKILPIKGVYQFVEGSNYGGYFYDKLKDEATDKSIKLLVPALLRKELKNNTTIEIRGYIARKLDNYGRIELQIVITELIEQRGNKFTEEDYKKIEVLNKKSEIGIKDVDSIIKRKIFNSEKITVRVILGKAAIIDTDIIKQMAEWIALYDINYHRVSFASEAEIASKIIEVAKSNPDIICVSRGGGDRLEIFDKPVIAEAAVGLDCAVVSAIGHEVNKTLFEKISDKSFITPTAFGQFLKEFYNETLQDFEQSKAKLAFDIKQTLEANYGKQISNLTQQLTASNELSAKTLADKEALYQKTLADTKALHATQAENLTKQIATIQEQFKIQLQEKQNVLAEREKNLNTHIASLVKEKEEKDKLLSQANSVTEQVRATVSNLQSQVASLQSANTKAIAIAAIIALVIGVILGKAL